MSYKRRDSRSARGFRAPRVAITGQDVLFIHWRVAHEAVEEILPAPLVPYTIDGTAWISVLAQEVTSASPASMSPLSVRPSPQLNVRTYVKFDGTIGVYFLHLLTGSRVGATLGKRLLGLSFDHGELSMSRRDDQITFRSRGRQNQQGLRFDARYRPVGKSTTVEPASTLEALTERHTFFVPQEPDGDSHTVLVGEIARDPWQIGACDAEIRTQTVLGTLGLESEAEPLIAYSPRYESMTESLSSVKTLNG